MLRSCSRSSHDISPRMIDATTSGMTIIWMRARKSWPGKASQLPTVLPTSGSSQPTPGPINVPATMPSTMPMSTCSQSRPWTRRRRASLENLSERG